MKKSLLTIGFADLSNFAELVSRAGDFKAFQILQKAFQQAGDEIINHGGEIRKYIGDTILFSFVNTKAAVTAARHIADINIEAENISLHFNIGLATGVVMIVQTGHPSKLVEDLFGQVVNQAAILSKKAHQSEDRIALCPVTLLSKPPELLDKTGNIPNHKLNG